MNGCSLLKNLCILFFRTLRCVKAGIEDCNKPKMLENPLNDRFEKAEFHKIWNNNQPQVCITASGIHTRVLERRHRIFAEQKSCLYPMRLPGLLLWGGYTSKFA